MKNQIMYFVFIIILVKISQSALPNVGGLDGVYNVLDFIPSTMDSIAVKNAIATNNYNAGITSVDQVIQNAINTIIDEYIDNNNNVAPNKDNWKELVLPHGTYRITYPVYFSRRGHVINLRVVGKGAVIDNRCTSSVTFSLQDVSASAFVFGTGNWSDQSSIVRGISFTSERATSEQNRHGIFIQAGKMIIEDCEFFNLSSGIIGYLIQYSKFACNRYCDMNRYGIEIHRDLGGISINDNNLIEFNNQLDYSDGLGGMWLDISESTVRNNQYRGIANTTCLYIQGGNNVVRGNTLETGVSDGSLVNLMIIKHVTDEGRFDMPNIITENLFQNSFKGIAGNPNLHCLQLIGCGWCNGLAYHTVKYNTFLGNAQAKYISKDGEADIRDNQYTNPNDAQPGWDTTHFKSNVKIEGSFESGLTSVYGNSAQNGFSLIANSGISSQSLYLNEVSSSGPSLWFNSRMAMVPTTGGDINKKDITFSFGNYVNSNNQANTEILRIRSDGNVGIGTVSPNAKLEIKGGDLKISDQGNGIILKSPDGFVTKTLYLKNDGTIDLK